jgi:hypothetical protein
LGGGVFRCGCDYQPKEKNGKSTHDANAGFYRAIWCAGEAWDASPTPLDLYHTPGLCLLFNLQVIRGCLWTLGPAPVLAPFGVVVANFNRD